MKGNDDFEILSETENLTVWRSIDEDVGYVYHLELGNLSLHLMPEEWEELEFLIRNITTEDG